MVSIPEPTEKMEIFLGICKSIVPKVVVMIGCVPEGSRPRKDGRFFDKSRMLRVLILFLLAGGIFFFLHNREIKIPFLEVGSTASKYIVAEVPFTFVDEEATAAARNSVLFDIGKIYQIGPDDILKRRRDFENSLISDQGWRVISSQVSFDEMCRACDKLCAVLSEVRLSDPRTIVRLKEMGLDVSDFLEIVPIDPQQGICFPDKMWEIIKKKAFGDLSFSPATIDFLMAYLKDKIWLLRFDTALSKKIRKEIRLQVPQKYVTIPAGTRIIDSGEKISAKHLSMIQAMKQTLSEKRDLWSPGTILGSAIVTGILLVTAMLFFKSFYPSILTSNSTIFLITSIVLLSLFMAKLCELLFLSNPHSLIDVVHFPLITPFVGMLLCILINPGVSLFITAILSVLFYVSLAFDFQGFLLTNLLVSFIVIFYTRTLRRRAEIVTICARGWLVACALIAALYLCDTCAFGESFIADIASAGVFMVVTAILVVGLLPFFESFFRVITDINLIEYMNPSNELLRRLMVEAPGTYQHSLLLGSVSEAAAQAIGCNGLFCRVATLYHDIGKVAVAQYFTENQQSGMNIHQLLTPSESARVITSHVNEGVALARRAGLPEPFIDIIREHHGTSLVYYFYHKQLESVGHNVDQVDEREFRYAGPKPRSKESAIIMIADSFEAACRSIDEINEEILTRLIDQIVHEKMEDGQLDECLLSFEELGLVKKAMVRCLLSIGHFRIKYPTKVKIKPMTV